MTKFIFNILLVISCCSYTYSQDSSDYQALAFSQFVMNSNEFVELGKFFKKDDYMISKCLVDFDPQVRFLKFEIGELNKSETLKFDSKESFVTKVGRKEEEQEKGIFFRDIWRPFYLRDLQ